MTLPTCSPPAGEAGVSGEAEARSRVGGLGGVQLDYWIVHSALCIDQRRAIITFPKLAPGGCGKKPTCLSLSICTTTMKRYSPVIVLLLFTAPIRRQFNGFAPSQLLHHSLRLYIHFHFDWSGRRRINRACPAADSIEDFLEWNPKSSEPHDNQYFLPSPRELKQRLKRDFVA